MAIEIQRCAACGTAAFPPHVRCATCGAADPGSEEVAEGVLERTTIALRSLGGAPADPPTVGRVRTAGGVALIVRVAGGAEPGATVSLDLVDGAIVAAEVA